MVIIIGKYFNVYFMQSFDTTALSVHTVTSNANKTRNLTLPIQNSTMKLLPIKKKKDLNM